MSGDAKRIPGLDGLRGLAVLLVMGHHAAMPGFTSGFVGVDVFFVLSGFLITGIVLNGLQSGRFNLLSFYRRRGARIVPAAWLLIAGVMAAAALLHVPWKKALLWQALPYALTFSTQFQLMAGGRAGPFTHLWSLSWEVLYYLLWPLLLLLAHRARALRPFFVLTVAVALACMAVRAAVFMLAHKPVWMLAVAINRVDGFIVGGAMAFLLAGRRGSHPASPWGRLLPALALAGLLAVSALPVTPGVFSYGFNASMLAAALLIAVCVRQPDAAIVRLLEAAPLRFTGEISYGLYLWHPPLIAILNPRLPDAAVRWPLYVALSFALAAASYFLIERRFLARR